MENITINTTSEALESNLPYELCFFDNIENPSSKSLVYCVIVIIILLNFWLLGIGLRNLAEYLSSRTHFFPFYEAFSRSSNTAGETLLFYVKIEHMEGRTINEVLLHNPVTKKYFMGTFPADRIPKLSKYPCSFVLNMDNSNKPGSHWVAVYVPNSQTVLYYDSYGIKPYNKNIQKFLKKFPNSQKNNITFQSIITDVCGYYVIFFIYMASWGYSLEKIKKILKAQNNKDIFVRNFVHKNVL